MHAAVHGGEFDVPGDVADTIVTVPTYASLGMSVQVRDLLAGGVFQAGPFYTDRLTEVVAYETAALVGWNPRGLLPGSQ